MTYLTLFSRINFFTWSGHYKKLKLIGNLSGCPQILTMGRLTYKHQKPVYEIFSFEIFLKWERFFYEHSIFLNPISNMFCKFSLKLNMTNRRQLRDTLNKRKTKFALTCNVQKVIRALAFRTREKFDNSFLFKIVSIVW